jgi:serine/threonine-protein kinase RsbW
MFKKIALGYRGSVSADSCARGREVARVGGGAAGAGRCRVPIRLDFAAKWVSKSCMQPGSRADPAAGESLSKSFPAVAESVPSARDALSRFAQAAGANEEQIDAIKLAVSEAATNVVVHAYGENSGEIKVDAALASGDLWIHVADDGLGMRPNIDTPGLGVGIALISQVADEFAIATSSSGGVEVQMRFELGLAGGSGHQPDARSATRRKSPRSRAPLAR